MTAIPTMSIVVDPGDIFGPDGFYDYDGTDDNFYRPGSSRSSIPPIREQIIRRRPA